jgi:hypothetical protein
MADNVTLNTMTGGDTVSADDIGGVKVQRVKVQYGADGSATDIAPGAGLPIVGGTVEVSGSVTSATAVITSTDCLQYGWVSVHLTSVGSSNGIQFQVSNDNTNWIGTNLIPVGGGTPDSFATNAGVYLGPLGGRYFRVQVTSYSSGTVAATASLTSAARGWPTQQVSATLIPVSVSGLGSGYALGSTTDTSGSTIDSSSARTTSANGSNWGRYTKGGLFLIDVTAVSGTAPTLVVRLQTSVNSTSAYVDVDTTNAQTSVITATGTYMLRVYPGLDNVANAKCNSLLAYYTRFAWTIGGTTPSFTFSTRGISLT